MCIFTSLNRWIFQINRCRYWERMALGEVTVSSAWEKNSDNLLARQTLFPAPDTMSQSSSSRISQLLWPCSFFSSSILAFLCVDADGPEHVNSEFSTILPWAIVWSLAALAPMAMASASWIVVPEKVEIMAALYQGVFGSGWERGNYWRLKSLLNSSQQYVPSPTWDSGDYQHMQIYTIVLCFSNFNNHFLANGELLSWSVQCNRYHL